MLRGLFLLLDRLFLPAYHLVRDPVLAYFLGTFLLALGCVVLGQLLLYLIVAVNRNHTESLLAELVHWNNPAVEGRSCLFSRWERRLEETGAMVWRMRSLTQVLGKGAE